MQSSRYRAAEQGLLQARLHGWRQRVVYVTRPGAGEVKGPELLSFRHLPDDSGAQLPAGGLDPGETLAQAAAREVLEETGLSCKGPPLHLGSCRWELGGRAQVWHYFQLTAPAGAPDAWTHVVTGGVGDLGLTFAARFSPLTDPDLTPGLGSHEYLPELTQLLARPSDEHPSSEHPSAEHSQAHAPQEPT